MIDCARRNGVLLAVLVSLCASPEAGQAQSLKTQPCKPKRAGVAVQEVLATNLLVNRFDVWVLDAPWARVDFETWNSNLRLGWEWDEDGFTTNMFGHPFHGSQYFNAGRSNCLSFWESVPLTFLGSWTWEYFGENYRPSFNDFFMTSLGGIALGEMTHRVAAAIRDDESRGTERITREVAALVVNPVEGFNRLFRGEWSQVGQNAPEHNPGLMLFGIRAGARRVHEDSSGISNVSPTLLVNLRYGDPLEQPYEEPFDVFSVQAQVSPGGGGLNTLQAAGRLYQVELPAWGSRARHALVVSQQYDYLHNPVYRFGGQSIKVGLVSCISLLKGFSLRTEVAGDVVVMGAINAPFGGVGERTYDFGPGLGATVGIALERDGKPWLAFYNRAEYLHSVSGTPADHLVAFSGLEGNFSLSRGFGIGFYLTGDARISRYTDQPEITRQFLETRIFVSWTNAHRPVTEEIR